MLDRNPIFIRFDETHTAVAVRALPYEAPESVLNRLNLPAYRGILVIHGGAANMEEEMILAVRQFLGITLGPLAQNERLLIAAGGTQFGVSMLLGEIRQQVGGNYPLLGVLPFQRASYPGGPPPDDRYLPLHPAYSHFVFVEGSEFGEESPLLVGLLQACGKPGLALIINGGEIVLQEARTHAESGNRLVTLAGSGRTADQLADFTSDERRSLPASVHLSVAQMSNPPEFVNLIKRLLFG
ncbi:MAG: hypothetical protein HY866_02285 [Chloroflexi bacterium]|nr:hypothetical protein [Chloroflexota bacterium]